MSTEIKAKLPKAKEYYQDKPMAIRYWIGGFLVLIMVVQLMLPWRKDITDPNTVTNVNTNMTGNMQIMTLDTNVPLTGQYSVYANILDHIDKTMPTKQKDQFQAYLKSQKFVQIRNILKEEGVMTDFAILPRILTRVDSQYSVGKYSEEKQVGIWALEKSVAKQYGARVDYFIDERLLVDQSTIVMAQYIKELYSLYGDWNMVLLSLLSKDKREIREQYVIASKYIGNRNNYIKDLGENKIDIMQMFQKPQTWDFYRDTSLVNTKFLNLIYRKIKAKYPHYVFENKPVVLKKEKIVVEEELGLNIMSEARKNNISYGVLKILNPWILEMRLPKGERELTFVNTLKTRKIELEK